MIRNRSALIVTVYYFCPQEDCEVGDEISCIFNHLFVVGCRLSDVDVDFRLLLHAGGGGLFGCQVSVVEY
jgi:hypothetical protein